METLKTKSFWSLFAALVLTSIAFKFFPDPYSKDALEQEGLSNSEIYRRFAIYFGIGLVILFITSLLFSHAIKSGKAFLAA